MLCGRERMCEPCWGSSPDEAVVICSSVYEMLATVRGNVAQRDLLEATVGNVYIGTVVEPTTKIYASVETRIFDEGIETYPLTRVLPDLELDE